MRLSANFTLAEFTKSQTATRKGINNTPDNEHLENAKKLSDDLADINMSYFELLDNLIKEDTKQKYLNAILSMNLL